MLCLFCSVFAAAKQLYDIVQHANNNPFTAECTKLVPPLGILGATLCTASIVERFGFLLLHASFVCFGHLQETLPLCQLLLPGVHTYCTDKKAFCMLMGAQKEESPAHWVMESPRTHNDIFICALMRWCTKGVICKQMPAACTSNAPLISAH